MNNALAVRIEVSEAKFLRDRTETVQQILQKSIKVYVCYLFVY